MTKNSTNSGGEEPLTQKDVEKILQQSQKFTDLGYTLLVSGKIEAACMCWEKITNINQEANEYFSKYCKYVPEGLDTQITELLTGDDLISKVDELKEKGASSEVIAKACGYITTKKDGGIRFNLVALFEALTEAKGLLPTPSAQNRQSDYQRGLEKERNGDLESAIKYYQKALESSPNSPAILNSIGVANSKTGEKRAAIEFYTRALDIAPNDLLVLNNRATCKSDINDYEGAIDDCNLLIDLDTNNPDQYMLRARIKYEKSDFEGAIDDCTKAIELDPKDATKYYKLGLAKFSSGDEQGAISDFSKAIELNPDSDSAYYSRGIAKRKIGDAQGAISDLSKAIELDPDADDAYLNRGRIFLTEVKDFKSAINDFDKCIEIDSDDDYAYQQRGLAKKELGDIEGACDDWIAADGIAESDETYELLEKYCEQ